MAYAKETEVPVVRSKAEIEALLRQHKAGQVMTGIDNDQQRARLQFRLQERIIRFEVSWNPATQSTKGLKDRIRDGAQLERQRWRALLLVIKAKLECVESGIATFDEEFLPYIVLPNDQTVAQNVGPQIAQAYQDGLMPKQLAGLPTTSRALQSVIVEESR